MFNYPNFELDLEAKLNNNLVKDEQHSINTANNDYRIIVPQLSPIYTKDFILKHSTSSIPLTEGVDFNFTNKYTDISSLAKYPLYAGVVLLNNNLSGEFSLIYRTIGGQYTLPSSKVLDYLVNKINDPIDIKWSNIEGRLVQYAMDEHTYNWHDHQNTQHVANALKELASSLANTAEDNNKVNLLIDRVNALEVSVNASNFNSHVANTKNPHKVTPAQIGALPVNAPAVNTLKVYGKSLVELVNYIISKGVNKDVLNKYLHVDGRNPLLKTLKIAIGSKIVNDDDSYTAVLFDSNLTNLQALNGAMLRSNADLSGSAVTKVKAGANEVTIESNGNAVDYESFKVNGHKVITGKNIKKFMSEITAVAEVNIKTKNKGNVSFNGSGTGTNPLQVVVDIPEASLTTKGCSIISSTASEDEASVASSTLLSTIHNNTSSTVSSEHTINGHRLTSDVVVTKGDIGLSNVNNTSPSNKPLTNSEKSQLANKSPRVHTHNKSDIIGYPLASPSVKGLAKLVSDSNSGAGDGNVLTPKALKTLSVESDKVKRLTENMMPVDSGVDYYGDGTYLPVPAQGSYGAAGITPYTWSFACSSSPSGRWVFLRPGADLSVQGIYYTYCDITESGQILNLVKTSTQYKPSYVIDGNTLITVISSCDSCMIVMDNRSNYYFVETNGTMDSNKHHGKLMTNVPEALSSYVNIYRTDTRTFFINSYYNNSELGIRTSMIENSDMALSGTEIRVREFESFGTCWDGVVRGSRGKFLFNTKTVVDASADHEGAIMVRHDNGYWNGIEVRHAALNTLLGGIGNEARLLFSSCGYQNNAHTSSSCNYIFSMKLSFKSSRVTVSLDTPASNWPISLNTSGLDVSKFRGNCNGNGFPDSHANNTTRGFYIQGKLISLCSYGRLNTPVLSVSVDTGNRNVYENLNAQVRTFTRQSTMEFIGNYGSPVVNNPLAIHALPNKTLLGTSRGRFWKYQYSITPMEGFNGLGPTVNREEISLEKYRMIKRIPTYTEGSNVTLNGYILMSPNDARVATKYNITNDVFSDYYGITSAKYNEVKNSLITEYVLPYITNSITLSTAMTLYRFGNGIEFAVITVFHKSQVISEASAGIKHITSFIVSVSSTYVMSGDTHMIDTVRHHGLVKSFVLVTSATSIGNPSLDYSNGSSATKIDGSAYGYMLNNNPYYSYVGNGRSSSYIVAGFNGTYKSRHVTMYEYEANGFVYIPDLGLCGLSVDSTAEGIYGKKLIGNSVDNWAAGGLSNVNQLIVTTSMPNLWTLYITSEMPLFFKGVHYELPATNFDLTALFPDNYKNKTLYMYVHIDEDKTAKYLLSLSTLPENIRMFIGTVVTDSKAITHINIKSTVDYHNYGLELNAHKANKKAHIDFGKSQFGAGNLNNYPLVNYLNQVNPETGFNKYYISVKALVSALDGYGITQFKIISGRIKHKNRLPIKSSWSGVEYEVFVSEPIQGSSSTKVTGCSYDHTENMAIVHTEGVEDLNATCKYYIIYRNH